MIFRLKVDVVAFWLVSVSHNVLSGWHIVPKRLKIWLDASYALDFHEIRLKPATCAFWINVKHIGSFHI